MTDEQILLELQKINKKLEIFSNPFRNAGRNFTSGVFHSLGNLFGTVIVAGILVYVFSQLNITQKINDYFKSLIPVTQFKIENPFSLPSSDQL